MDTGSFEALLKADGFQDIETKIYEPKPANGTHGHHYAVRGFVLNGAFTVSVDGVATTYRTGQIFEVKEGVEHFEEVGGDGAKILIGRKY